MGIAAGSYVYEFRMVTNQGVFFQSKLLTLLEMAVACGVASCSLLQMGSSALTEPSALDAQALGEQVAAASRHFQPGAVTQPHGVIASR